MKEIIAWPVRPISNINELSAKDGTRQLGFPFFVFRSEGWELHVISEDTDPDELLKLIKHQKVFIKYDLND